MSERFKYSLNGVYRCENFAQHLAADNFTGEYIDSAGGIDDWFIKLRTENPNNKTVVFPWIYSDTVKKELGVKCLFRVLKKDGSTAFLRNDSYHLKPTHGPNGSKIDILEFLNKKNGYLDDGSLVVEYGFQVESILGKDNIWRFNTKDPLFNCQEKKNMIQIHDPSSIYLTDFYVHKQILTFHSSFFKESCEDDEENLIESIPDKRYFSEFEQFLQICQGVHERSLDAGKLAKIMNIAVFYSFPNVILYCERQLIENDLKLRYMKSWVIHLDDLRHYLVHLLKDMKSPRELVKKKDIKKMKGETMKMFIAKFLYNKF